MKDIFREFLTHMSNMNILLSKLLRQTLTQRPQPELTHREYTRHNASRQTRLSTCEYQGASRALGFLDVVFLECQNGFTGKGKARLDVDLEGFGYLSGGNVEEGLPHPICGVEYRYADGKLRRGKVGADGGECGGDIGGGVG